MAMLPQFEAPGVPADPPIAEGAVEEFSGSISVVEALKFPFRQGDWKKHALFGALLFFIPVVGPLTLGGHMAEIMQRLVRREPNPLPAFDFLDLGHYLMRGLVPFLVQLLFQLPVMLLGYMVFGVFVGIGMSLGRATDPIVAPIFMLVGWLIFMGVMMVGGVFMAAARLRAELSEDFGEAFKLGPLWDYSKNTWLAQIGHGLLLGLIAFPMILVGMLLCIVGMYPVVALLMFGTVHLRWQIYEQYLSRGGTPSPIKAKQQLPSEAPRYGY